VPRISIQPLAVVIEARRQDTIMAAAQAQGYYWPTTCGGEGRCTTCAAAIIRGKENLSEISQSERRTIGAELGPAALEQGIRLACQARVLGDVEVLKPGVRRNWHVETSGLELRRPGRPRS
jgi:2Fe-2S ferredoxin